MSVFLNFCNTFPPWLKEKIWSKSKLKGNDLCMKKIRWLTLINLDPCFVFNLMLLIIKVSGGMNHVLVPIGDRKS